MDMRKGRLAPVRGKFVEQPRPYGKGNSDARATLDRFNRLVADLGGSRTIAASPGNERPKGQLVEVKPAQAVAFNDPAHNRVDYDQQIARMRERHIHEMSKMMYYDYQPDFFR